MKNSMSKNDKNFCEYSAVFGSLISLTCILQLFLYANLIWITMIFMTVFIFVIISYVMFGLQKRYSVIFLFISFSLSFFLLLFYYYTHVWSLIVICLVLYNIAVTTVILMDNFPGKIKSQSDVLLEENKFWEGKL